MSLRVIRRKDTGTYQITGTIAGGRIRKSAQSRNRRLAQEEAADLERHLIRSYWYGQEPASRTFAEAVESYLQAEQRAPGDQRRIVCIMQAIGTDVPLSAINQEKVDEVRNRVLGPSPSPATVRRSIITPIRAIMLHAHRRGWCDRPSFEIPRQPAGRTLYLLPAEAERLIAAAAPHLRPILIMLLCTGARVAEVLELDWREVDLVGARATFWTKGNPRRRRVVELPPRAVAALAALPHREGRVFLWGHRKVERPEPSALLDMIAQSSNVAVAARYGITEAAVRKWVKEAESDGAGISKPASAYADRGREGGGQIKRGWASAVRRAELNPDLTPHALRHTFASWHYAIHHDPLRLMVDGQWSSLELVTRYAHLMPAGHEQEIRDFLCAGAQTPATRSASVRLD